MLREREPIDRQDWADETQITFLSPILTQLYEYWDERRAGNAMPARSDIDPIHFPYALGYVLLVDVLRAPMRHRIRLHGTDLAWRAGYDMTGRMLDDLPVTDFRMLVQRSFDTVAAERRPLRSERQRTLDARLRHYEALILPMGTDRSTVDMLLVGLIHHHHVGP